MAKKTASYTELKTELEGIIARLQSSELEIDVALELHERAEEIIALLETQLSEAKNIIEQRQANESGSQQRGGTKE